MFLSSIYKIKISPNINFYFCYEIIGKIISCLQRMHSANKQNSSRIIYSKFESSTVNNGTEREQTKSWNVQKSKKLTALALTETIPPAIYGHAVYEGLWVPITGHRSDGVCAFQIGQTAIVKPAVSPKARKKKTTPQNYFTKMIKKIWIYLSI